MILEGNQRAGGNQLALHLLNTLDNDHVEVHEVSGFISSDLKEAFGEAYAISKGTRCKQFLYSLSLNPPQNENVPIAVVEETIQRVEQSLGLSGQPRAIVFHEKNGRRHAHCVWSRIDISRMRAINLPHTKRKLRAISRDLYLEQGWTMPDGFKRKQDRSRLNLSREEWQQASRLKQDPQALKAIFVQCWQNSDSSAAFASALREYGLILAQGDRRGHVAVDSEGNVYAISRWVGVKAREVRQRLGLPDELPTVEAAQALLQNVVAENDDLLSQKAVLGDLSALNALKRKNLVLKKRHQAERKTLRQQQEKRRMIEVKQRAESLPIGFRLLWSKASGQYQRLIERNIQQVKQTQTLERGERQSLIEQQMRERCALQFEIETYRYQHQLSHKAYLRDLGKQLRIDPTQALILPGDDSLTQTQRIKKDPMTILDVISDKEEFFTRNDIVRSLAKHISEPVELRSAIDQLMASNELIAVQGKVSHYTTQAMRRVSRSVQNRSDELYNSKGFGTPKRYQQAAIGHHNALLTKECGATLSDEQTSAIEHLLGHQQLSLAVGIAGAGKSTLLAAAHDAWTAQGRTVLGGALSGKAADGLHASSNIKSRTLASWLKSWKNGYHEPQAGDVFVLDEAGMVGSRQLLQFIEAAKRYQMKLVLVGDPEQLQPIQAGTPLRDLTERLEHAKLMTVLRQEKDWQRQATVDFAEQRTDQAINAYKEHNKVKELDTADQAIAALVESYMTHKELYAADESRVALAYRRKDVHTINQCIRMARQTAGELGDEIRLKTDHGQRAFAVGDRVVFTQNDHSSGIRNGVLGTVKKIKDNKLIIKLDGDSQANNSVQIDTRIYTSIDHGYATTIHKSQGVTVDQAFVLQNGKLDRHLTYVAMTRHKKDVQLYQVPNRRQYEQQLEHRVRHRKSRHRLI